MSERRIEETCVPAADGPRRVRDIAATLLRIIAASLVVGVILAVSGGFGAGGATVLSRLAYWLVLVAIGSTLGVLIGVFVMPRAWFAERPWVTWGLIVLALWPLMTVLGVAANALINHRSINFALCLEEAPSTLAITAAMTTLAFLVRPRTPIETHAAPKDAPPAKFLARLPAKLAGATLWAVEAENHYLRLHTSLGQDLILLRLGDAIAELEGIEGSRTHRSWWVARAAVRRVEREDGRATLVLADGLEAPVSRAYAKTLRAAGWF